MADSCYGLLKNKSPYLLNKYCGILSRDTFYLVCFSPYFIRVQESYKYNDKIIKWELKQYCGS